MVRFQILTGKMAGQEFQARRFPFQIGRSPQCDLPLDEPGVWDRHLTIRLKYPDGFEAHVQEPALVTLNDASVQSTRLRNGDVLGLGSLKLAFGLTSTRSRSLKAREWLTWLGFAALFAGQLILIYMLPG